MISISTEARERLVDLLKDRTDIRLDMIDKGCGGKTFAFDFTDAVETDELIEIGAERRLAISAVCPTDLSIGWDSNVFTPHFTFESESISSRCGCGTSFKFG